ncbi:MAG: isoprenoid biosynthesis glyoxalase ElbB, partial [Myxococcales bacterium]
MAVNVGVILSGCGVYDGAEIHESVLTLLHLTRAGANIRMYAPNKPQMHVINHLNGDVMPETRNVLVEAARIARGKVEDVNKAKVADLDALIFPGGFGAAKNLSDFAVKGAGATVDPDVRVISEAMQAAKKPIGFICIAPA